MLLAFESCRFSCCIGRMVKDLCVPQAEASELNKEQMKTLKLIVLRIRDLGSGMVAAFVGYACEGLVELVLVLTDHLLYVS